MVGGSVAISIPTISIAWSWRLFLMTNCSDARIAAADPSDVGQHWSFVNGPNTLGDSSISFNVYSFWNWEYLKINKF